MQVTPSSESDAVAWNQERARVTAEWDAGGRGDSFRSYSERLSTELRVRLSLLQAVLERSDESQAFLIARLDRLQEAIGHRGSSRAVSLVWDHPKAGGGSGEVASNSPLRLDAMARERQRLAARAWAFLDAALNEDELPLGLDDLDAFEVLDRLELVLDEDFVPAETEDWPLDENGAWFLLDALRGIELLGDEDPVGERSSAPDHWPWAWREAFRLQRDQSQGIASSDTLLVYSSFLRGLETVCSAALRSAGLREDRDRSLTSDARFDLLNEGRAVARFLGEVERARHMDLKVVLHLRGEGRYSEALALARTSQEEFAERTESLYYLWNAEADLLRNLGRPRKAAAVLEKLGHELPHDPRFDSLRGSAELVRGLIHLEFGEHDAAEPLVNAELERTRRLPRTPLEGSRIYSAWVAALRLSQQRGRHAQTLEMVDKFLVEAPLLGDVPSRIAQLLYFRGKARSYLARFGEDALLPLAEEDLRQVLEHQPSSQVRFDATIQLADVSMVKRCWSEALEFLDQAEALCEEWASHSEQDVSTYMKSMIPAFRARIALETGAPEQTLRELVPRLKASLDEVLQRLLRRETRSEGSALLFSLKRRALLEAWIDVQLALDSGQGGMEAALAPHLVLDGDSTLARKMGVGAVRWATVQAKLVGPRRGILWFVPGFEGSHVFAVDSHRATAAKIKVSFTEATRQRARYAKLLVGSYEKLQDPVQAERLLAEERALAAEIFAASFPQEILEVIEEWEQVSLVGWESFGPLAPTWLPLEDGTPFGLAKDVTVLPSLSVAEALRSRRERRLGQARNQDLLLVGGTELSPWVTDRWGPVAPFPLTKGVVERCAGSYDAPRTRILSEGEASVRALRSAGLSTTRVLQFLTHGVEDGDRLRPSGLVMSPDQDEGVLWCDTVETLESPDLVMMGACRSGIGVRQTGDPGIRSLSSAWLSQGATDVLAMTSDAQSRPLVLLSEQFHRFLRKGESPARALRRALQSVAQGDPAASIRYGQVALFGLGDLALFEAPSNEGWSSPWVLLAVLVTLMVSFVFVRRLRDSVPKQS